MPLSNVTGAGSISRPGVCTSTTRPSSPYDGQVIYMTDADQTAVWDGSSWVVLAPIAGGRNALINGALGVWQRGTSFTTSGVYSADRFIVGRSGGGTGATFTRVATSDSTNLPFFRYAMRCQRDSGNTATNGLTFGQVIETANSIPLAGKTVTLSFYARAGGTFTGTYLYSYIYTGTGTDQNGILGAWTGHANPASGSHALTTTWTRYSITGTLSSTTTGIFFNVASSPTGTAGANDYYEITGIQLEAGAVATPFEFEDIGTTLAKCQRYYQRISNWSGIVDNASSIGANAQFIVRMRTGATVTKINGSTLSYRTPAADNSSTTWGFSAPQASDSWVWFQISSLSGLNTGQAINNRGFGNDILEATAEL